MRAANIHVGDTIVPPGIDLDRDWARGGGDTSGPVDDFIPTIPTHLKYPKPIATWDTVPHQVYGDVFHVDVLPLHMYSYPDSPYGDLKVEVEIKYGGSTTGLAPATLTQKTASLAGLPSYFVYRKTYNADQDFAHMGGQFNGAATVHFQIAPARGDAQSKLTSPNYSDTNSWNTDVGVQPNLESMQIFLNGGNSPVAVPVYAVVDPTAISPGGQISTNYATAAANPFLTIEAAKDAFITGAGPNAPLTNVLLRPGHFRWGPTPTGHSPEPEGATFENPAWMTIKADDLSDPPVLRSQAVITNAAFDIKFNVEEEGALRITRNNFDPTTTLEWRWTTGQFQMRKSDGSVVLVFNRYAAPQTDATILQLRNAIDNHAFFGPRTDTEILNNHGDWGIRDSKRFPGLTGWATVPQAPGVSLAGLVDASAHLFVDGNDDGVLTISYRGFERSYSLATPGPHDTVGKLVNAIQNDWTQPPHAVLTSANVIRDIPSTILKTTNGPIRIPWQERLTFEENWSSAGVDARYVKIENCETYSIGLQAKDSASPPQHLWLHKVASENASNNEDTNSPRLAQGNSDWKGGIWLTAQELKTMNQCGVGWAMARDVLIDGIGGDVFKQALYAGNIQASNVFLAPRSFTHPDFFQWTLGNNFADNHGNIILLNFDFRVNCDGQPFFFDDPFTPHLFHNIAIVNMRADAVQLQAFEGNGDHILVWNSTILQGELLQEHPDFQFAVFFRGYSDSPAGPSRYTNVSVRNLVCERLWVTGEGGGTMGDVPSLFAAVDNLHVDDEMRDETGAVNIVSYPGPCTTHVQGDPSLFTDYPIGHWRPNLAGKLANRVIDEDIVYRIDALGVDRKAIVGDGAVGAVEQ